MATKRCPFCHKEIDAGCRKCPYCGHLLVEDINPNQLLRHSLESVTISSTKQAINSRVKKRKANLRKLAKYSIVLTIILFIILLLSGGKQLSKQERPTQAINNSSIKAEKHYSSLPNGTVIQLSSPYLTGVGRLKIENGDDYDAVAKLISASAGRSIYTVYIKAQNTYSINKILDGKYKLLFMRGRNWDRVNQTFLVDKSYSEFSNDFNFITRKVIKGNYLYEEYTEHTVTLYPVYNGNARTKTISGAEFNKY